MDLGKKFFDFLFFKLVETSAIFFRLKDILDGDLLNGAAARDTQTF